jgi:hypothetical protein
LHASRRAEAWRVLNDEVRLVDGPEMFMRQTWLSMLAGVACVAACTGGWGCSREQPPQPARPAAAPASAPNPAPSTEPAKQPEPTPTPQAATGNLRWNWGTGQQATYRLKTEQAAENSVEQMKQRSEGGTEMLATFTGAAPEPSGTVPVAVVLGELSTHEFNLGVTKNSRSTPLKEGQLDSMRNAALRAMIGEGAVALVEPSGNVQNMEGMQSVYQGARGRIKNDDTKAWLDQMYKFFNPDNLRFNLGTAFGVLPGAEKRVGDTWQSRSVRDSNAGFLAFDREWTLESISEEEGRRTATITGTTRVTLPENTGLLSSFDATTVTKGEGTARVTFDLARGVIVSARMETTIEFDNRPVRDPIKYKPYTQSMTDIMTLTLEGFGDAAKTFTKIADPDVHGPMEPDGG